MDKPVEFSAANDRENDCEEAVEFPAANDRENDCEMAVNVQKIMQDRGKAAYEEGTLKL